MPILRIVLIIVSLGYLFIAIACNSVSTQPISPLISLLPPQVLEHQQEFTPTEIVTDPIRLLQPMVLGGMDGPGMEPMYDFAAQVRGVDLSRNLITIQPFADSSMSNSWIYTITVIPSPNGTLVMYAPDPYWEKAGLPATLADMTEGTWIEVDGHTPKAGTLQANYVYILPGAPNLTAPTPMMIATPFTGTTVSVGVDGTPTFTLDGRGRKPGDLALGITVASDCLITDNKGTPKTLSDLHQGMIVTVLEGEGDVYNFIARRVRIESK